MDTKHEAEIANDLLKRHSSYFILCRIRQKEMFYLHFLKHFHFLSGPNDVVVFVSPDLLAIVG